MDEPSLWMRPHQLSVGADGLASRGHDHRTTDEQGGWMAVQVRTDEEWTPDCGWTTAEVEAYLLGPFEGGTPGLVRRIRRILDVSQRGLAALIGVSQSVVARWETGRTSPRVSAVQQLMRLAGLRGAVQDVETGEEVEPMRDDGARDRRGRRFPAHVDLRVMGWYVPRGLDCTLDASRWRRSRGMPGAP